MGEALHCEMLREILDPLRFSVTEEVIGTAGSKYQQIAKSALVHACVFRLFRTDFTVHGLIAEGNGLITQSDPQLEIGKPFAEVIDGWQNDKSSKCHRHLHANPTSR